MTRPQDRGKGRSLPLASHDGAFAPPLDRLVMTVPSGAVTAITLAARSAGTTEIIYAFDVDEAMHASVEESVDDVHPRHRGLRAAQRGHSPRQAGQPAPRGMSWREAGGWCTGSARCLSECW
jgi:hypothetical protein